MVLLKKYRFRPAWTMTLLMLLALTILTALGYWQLKRAEEKNQILSAVDRARHAPVMAWDPGKSDPAAYQAIDVKGCYLPVIFFLDNQHYQHQFGYHVFSPLALENNQVVFLDRGWVSGDPQRQMLPAVGDLNQCVSLRGTVYYPSAKTWVLGQEIEQKDSNKYIIERFDVKILSDVLHKSVYPFIIRLGQNEPDGFVREWPVISVSPARHYGYALQWFAMALTVLLIYIGLNCKKVNEYGQK